jgi:hypothetical protein
VTRDHESSIHPTPIRVSGELPASTSPLNSFALEVLCHDSTSATASQMAALSAIPRHGPSRPRTPCPRECSTRPTVATARVDWPQGLPLLPREGLQGNAICISGHEVAQLVFWPLPTLFPDSRLSTWSIAFPYSGIEHSQCSDCTPDKRPRGWTPEFSWGQDISHLHVVHSGSRTHPTSYTKGNMEVRRPGLEADHSPQTTADVKITRVYNPLLHTCSRRSA